MKDSASAVRSGEEYEEQKNNWSVLQKLKKQTKRLGRRKGVLIRVIDRLAQVTTSLDPGISNGTGRVKAQCMSPLLRRKE